MLVMLPSEPLVFTKVYKYENAMATNYNLFIFTQYLTIHFVNLYSHHIAVCEDEEMIEVI